MNARSAVRRVRQTRFVPGTEFVGRRSGRLRPVGALARASSRRSTIERHNSRSSQRDRRFADAALELSERRVMLRAGVYWGTGLGGATSIEEAYRQLYRRERARTPDRGRARDEQRGRRDTSRSPTACAVRCSTSRPRARHRRRAIGEAYRAIRHGYADVIIAGGSEALVTNGNLRRVGRDAGPRACRPRGPLAQLQTVLGQSHWHRAR